MEVVLFYAIYIGAALLFSVAAVFAVGGALHAGTRKPEGFLVFFVLPMVIVMAATTLASGRNLMFPDLQFLAGGAEPGGWAKWLQRFATLFVLAASTERLARFAFSQRNPDRPVGLMIAFAGCWVAMVALPSAFGARPSLSHEYFYSLLIGLAALTTTEQGARTALKVARNALVLFAVASLVVLAVKRDLVMAPYLGGLIPVLPWRYYGLSTGPNAMGPLCVLTLLCLRAVPFESRALQRAAVFLALLSLVLTQSKSSWLAGLACWAAMAAVSERGRLADWLKDARMRPWVQLVVTLVIVVLALALLAVGGGLGQGKIERFFATRAGSDLMTLTGRNEIWAIAFDTFRAHPWFGYGPTIWDPLFRMQIGVPGAFHAHNQYINVLAASGVVGGVGFVVYLVVLLSRLWPRRSAYRGFAVGMLILLLMRSISEVPFDIAGFGSESLAQMLLLMVLAGAGTQEAKSREVSGERQFR